MVHLDMFNLLRKTRKKTPLKKLNTDIRTTIENEKKEVTQSVTFCRNIEITPLEAFSNHMSKYIGSTVTIFVASGGISGMGFTGALISSNSTYIRLLTQIGSPPVHSLLNPCIKCYMYKFGVPMIQLGSIACIPVKKIVGFVHNAL